MSTTHETETAPGACAPRALQGGRRRRTPRAVTAAVLAALATLTVLVGCSAGGDESASGETASGSLDARAAEDVSGGGQDSPTADSPAGLATSQSRGVDLDVAGNAAGEDTSGRDVGDGSSSGVAGRVPVESGLYIRTGQVTVVSEDLDAARAALTRTVQRYGGQVATERTTNDDDGALTSTSLTLRVPSARFADVMASFADLGDVQGSESQQDEVTTEVIDVASRIRTQEVSLGRLRGFLDRATSVSSIIRLESEIARREADLASLRGQQDYLEDQTSMSTIEATLRQASTPAKPAPEPDELEDAGFLTGLGNGWNALLDVLTVAATVLGALLPFALVLALVGVPLSLWLRATRRTRRAPGAPDPAV